MYLSLHHAYRSNEYSNSNIFSSYSITISKKTCLSSSKTSVSNIIAEKPQVLNKTLEMPSDPYSLLLRHRIVFLGGEVTDFTADSLVSHLILLDALESSDDIKLFINSPGGSVTAGMAIYDAMNMCRSEIQTVCFGLAASMGAFLLGAGTKPKRYSMPNSRIMIHQPLGGASGAAVDIEIQAREIMYHKANLSQIMAAYSNQSVEKIENDTDRDRYMSPIEAKEYGLIDHIIGGDSSGFNLEGSTRSFPQTKEEYISWGKYENADKPHTRFEGRPLEPFTKPML